MLAALLFLFWAVKLVNNPCIYSTVNINILWCVIMCIYCMIQVNFKSAMKFGEKARFNYGGKARYKIWWESTI